MLPQERVRFRSVGQRPLENNNNILQSFNKKSFMIRRIKGLKTLIRGEKVKLSDYTPVVAIDVELAIDAPFEIDFSCFCLNE